MAKAIINGGVCGFITKVEADSADMMNVSFKIQTDCPTIQKLAEILPEVDSYLELDLKFEGQICMHANSAGRGCCAGCIVPSGLSKVMQVATSLALPGDASIKFEE